MPVSAWQTRVNADRSITRRLCAPQTQAGAVVTGATPESYQSQAIQKDMRSIWSFTGKPLAVKTWINDAQDQTRAKNHLILRPVAAP